MLLRYSALISYLVLRASGFVVTDPATVWNQLQPGWNVGNTLDGIPNEDSWGNSPIQAQTFDDIKASGFKSVRIPITWTHHFATEAPDYTIDPTFLARVETVVDQALARGFWVVINVHHDSWEWADLSQSATYWTAVDKFEKLWKQIAKKLNTKSEKLIFESLNEPTGPRPGDKATSDLYNDLNLRFLNIVRNSGGYNKDRITSLPPLHTDITIGNSYFSVPESVAGDKWTYQVHYYTPWSFLAHQWGHTCWGDASERAEMNQLLTDLAGNFTRPKLIGEYGNIGEIGRVLERAAVYNWYDAFVRKAASLNIPVQLWDNGGDHFNRAARVWRDPTVKDIILTASSGKVNTLPECGYSTVWIKSGESTAKDIKLRWNGNTLVGVYTTSGAALQSGTDYTSGANGITLTPSYLATLPSTVGSLGKVVVKSSEGIDLTIEIRRYALPVIATTSYTAPNVNQDLSIPTNFNGATLAAVKAVKADGVFLKNDWTIWLGEPKAGRLDWGDFDYNSNSVIVKSGTLNMIKNSGQTVTLHFEFWPRSDSTNIVPVTISY